MKMPRALAWFAVTWTVVFWSACVAIPVLAVILRVHGLAALLDPSIRGAASYTFFQASMSTAVSAVIGFPLGLFAARAGVRPAKWLDTVLPQERW